MRFKTLPFWDLYLWHVVAVLLLVVAGCGLFLYLGRQRSWQRRAQSEVKQQLQFEDLLSRFSARLVKASAAKVDHEIKQALELFARALDLDRVAVSEVFEKDPKMRLVHSYEAAGVTPLPSETEFYQCAWARKLLFDGESIVISNPDDLPEEATAARDYFHAKGIQSMLAIPFAIGGETTSGLLALTMVTQPRKWPDFLIRHCSLIADVLANALERKRLEERRMQDAAKYRTVADFTYDWEYWSNIDGTMEYVSPSCERISGYTAQDFEDAPALFREIVIPEDREIWDSHYRDSRRDPTLREIEFRIQTRDGQIRWIEHICRPVTNAQDRLEGFRASNRDITPRKESELELREAYSEIEQLKIRLEAETAYLQEEIKLEHNFESIIGNSAAIQYTLFKVEQVAATETTVLVLGETGTGKELVARAIHNSSPRKGRSLMKVNCAALPSNLIESELFGHERGAFTSAQTRQLGRFEVADGTTLFLDEIGELPLELQAKLLGVLQDGEFQRLGSAQTIKINVRVIAATNRDLEEEVRRGRFREDLFYRLNIFPLTVPPLRDRTEDIPLLAKHFVEKVSKRLGKTIELIPANVMNKLQDYPWPGNVRELENVIERAVIISSGSKLRLADDLSALASRKAPASKKSLQEIEKEHIIQVLGESNWRIDGVKGAALILDMNPSTLRSRMRKLGIQKP